MVTRKLALLGLKSAELPPRSVTGACRRGHEKSNQMPYFAAEVWLSRPSGENMGRNT
jgi:hypothetical protein